MAGIGVSVERRVGVAVSVPKVGRAVTVSVNVGVPVARVRVIVGEGAGKVEVGDSKTAGLAPVLPGLAGRLQRLANPRIKRVKIRWNWRGNFRCIAR